MSLKVGHTLVQTDQFETLNELVKEFLDQWFKNTYLPSDAAVRVRSPEQFFLDDEGIRSLVILPPLDGWIALLERVDARVDLDLAQHVSRQLKSRVIATEVNGSRYRWANMVYEGGELTQQTLEPAGAFEKYYLKRAGQSGEEADRTEMPLYQDVEQLSLQSLLEAGVPTDLLFLSHDDVSAGMETSERQAMFLKIWERTDGPAFRHYLFSVRYDPVVRDEEPPVEVDHVELKTEISQQRIRERRYVYGTPSEAAVQRLADLEERFRERILEQSLRECVDEMLPEVEFQYHHEASDADFSRMMRSAEANKRVTRRALYHKALYSRYGFSQHAVDLLSDLYPDFVIRQGEGFRITFGRGAGADEGVWPLEKAYKQYLAGPERLDTIISEEFKEAAEITSGG